MIRENFRRYSAPVMRPNSRDVTFKDPTSFVSENQEYIFQQDDKERKIDFETSFYQFKNVLHRSNLSDLEKNNANVQPQTRAESYSSKCAFIGLGNILAPFFLTCFYTLIPVHNLFLYQ